MRMDELANETKRAESIFFPYLTKKMNAVREKRSRFVHYTTAEVAVSILKNRKVWMRNTQTMNDYMEFEHGFRCLRAAYQSNVGEQLRSALEAIFPGFVSEVEQRFNGWEPHIRHNTYITCISEHRDNEDKNGRLSMWRAYGGGNGVAMVLNNTAFTSDSQALNAYSSPVAYLDDKRFSTEFEKVANQVKKDASFIKTLGKERVLNLVFHMFRFAAVCTKHPGFHEEKEWRVIYSPDLEPSDRIGEEIQAVRGVPQKIHTIPLANIPEEGLWGVSIPDLLERIIIGPTQHPRAMFQAFHKLMAEAGIENPGERIFISDIPLRQ